MGPEPLLRTVDCVVLPVPDLDRGLAFYAGGLGHELLWRDDGRGQMGLRLPDGATELVLSTTLEAGPGWLVASVDDAVDRVVAAGGAVLVPSAPVPVGRLAVVGDPFGNPLVLLDLSHGRYTTDGSGRVTGVTADAY
jgi:catechol 2,3-dioxygenase-like lactoylglutathione lyase family enzyme